VIPQVGDLIKYNHPNDHYRPVCKCWFCMNDSNTIGIAVQVWDAQGPEPNIGMIVAFDAGEWVFREYDLEQIEILREDD